MYFFLIGRLTKRTILLGITDKKPRHFLPMSLGANTVFQQSEYRVTGKDRKTFSPETLGKRKRLQHKLCEARSELPPLTRQEPEQVLAFVLFSQIPCAFRERLVHYQAIEDSLSYKVEWSSLDSYTTRTHYFSSSIPLAK